MNGLLGTLEQDCRDWISKFNEILMNERHMQVELAIYLKKTKHYDKVHVEYAVPLEMLEARGIEVPKYRNKRWTTPASFPWHNQMYIDIMVEKDGKFAAVELKYATTTINKDLKVFNEETPKDIKIIKPKGAQDSVMYHYWKDVRRIEALTRFPKVVGGVALIVANDSMYWNKPEGEPVYSCFSTHEKHKVGGDLKWGKTKEGKKCEMSTSHPAFILDGSYTCQWAEATKIPAQALKSGEPFRFMINRISK